MAYLLFDPVTATMAAAGAAGSIGQGIEEQRAYEAQANEVKVQEKVGALQYSRDVKDTKEMTDAAIARRRALMAAGGASGTAQGTALLDAAAGLGGQNLSRMATDYQINRSSLRARRKNLKDAGQKALIKGFTNAAIGGAKAGAGSMGGLSGGGGYGATGSGKMIVGSNGMMGGGV